MSDIRSLFSALLRGGLISQGSLLGCNEEEIGRLEGIVGVNLPASYREFLQIAGKKAGKLFQGTDIFFPRVLELQSEAASLLEENNLPPLPHGVVVFSMHQGYEIDCFTTDSDDPPVLQYVEGEMEFSQAWNTFSEFIGDSIKQHTDQWGRLD